MRGIIRESHRRILAAATAGLDQRFKGEEDVQLELLEVLGHAKQNEIVGNILALSEVGSHVRNGIDAGKGIYHGGSWVIGKVAKLFG